MAVNRVLSAVEKDQMIASTEFVNQCLWAVRDFSSYWASTDQGQIGTQIGVAGYEGWYKRHTFATGVKESGFNNTAAATDFMFLAKGMNLWDSAIVPFDVTTCIAYMISASKFEELATAYVDLKTESVRF